MSDDTKHGTTRPTGEELDDFDAEGHGFREVAVGLAAVTVMGSGAAALAVDDPLPGTTGGAKAAVSGVGSDVQDRSRWALSTAGRLASSGTVRQAVTAVGGAATLAAGTAKPVVAVARGAVGATTGAAGEAVADAGTLATGVVRDPIGSTDRLVDDAVDTTRGVRDETMATAGTTMRTVLTTAVGAAGNAVKTAGSTAAAAVTTATGAAAGASGLLDPSVEASMGGDSASVTVGAADRTVSISIG